MRGAVIVKWLIFRFVLRFFLIFLNPYQLTVKAVDARTTADVIRGVRVILLMRRLNEFVRKGCKCLRWSSRSAAGDAWVSGAGRAARFDGRIYV